MVLVHTRASKNEIILQQDASYKVRLTSSAVKGQANKQLIECLSKEFSIPKSFIKIVKGKTSRNKVIEIIS